VKKEETDAEDGGLSQLADLLKAKDQEQELESRKAADPRTDAVQAILASAGVEYTHDNSEVVGTSKVEETLSRQAVERTYEENDAEGLGALFAESSDEIGDEGVHATYKPPEEVRLRQFCSMAQEFGFVNATEFALVVESWTQEARRNCLDTFYRRRAAKLATMTGDDPAKEERDGHGHMKEKKQELDETKVAIAKMEPTDPRTPLKKEPKVEATNFETKGERESSPLVNIKIEKKLTLKTEGTSKRNSIFLSDDDEDDEL
jgi:hypothetical protein